jgi:glucose-6-phosphate 1-dehydrogenase
VLNAIRRVTPVSALEIAVHAQYEGYLKEPNVPSDSRTPTYAAVRLDIENWRWQGVPFYLRTGKALNDKRTEIVIQFRRPPHLMFDQDISPNILAIQVQPDEGLHLEFQAKAPDEKMELRPVDLEFHYDDSSGGQAIPDAYERRCFSVHPQRRDRRSLRNYGSDYSEIGPAGRSSAIVISHWQSRTRSTRHIFGQILEPLATPGLAALGV